MVDRYLRPWKARAYAPLTRRLRGVAPDAVSALGLAAGSAAAAAAAAGRFAPALALWLLNRVLDGLDGELARPRAGVDGGRPAVRGAYLDLMLDLTVYAVLPLGIAAGVAGTFGTPPLAAHALAWPAAAAALAAFYLNLGSWALLAQALPPADTTAPLRTQARTLAAAEADPAPGLRMPAGLVEGAETIVAFTAALAWPAAAPAILLAFALLTAVGAAQRTAWGLRRLAAPGARP